MEPSTLEARNRSANVAMGVAVVVTTAVVAAAVSWFIKNDRPDDASEVPGGVIALTITSASTTAAYAYAVEDEEIDSVDPVAEDVPSRAVESSTGRLVYVCLSGGAEAVCVFDPSTRERRVVSANDQSLKSNLAWSPDGESVLYTAWAPATSTDAGPIPTSMDPNLWSVFLAKADGSGEERLAIGSTAFFSPDGATVFYLERTGLHALELASGSSTISWPVSGGPAHRFMQIAVSPDGKRLAWADPAGNDNQGRLAIYSIRSWSPLDLELEEDLVWRPRSLAFGPDSASLALISYVSGGPELFLHQVGSTLEKIADLREYGRNAFVSEWR